MESRELRVICMIQFDYKKFQKELNAEISQLIDEFEETLLIPKMKSLLLSWRSRRSYRDDWSQELEDQIIEFAREDSVSKIRRKVGLNEESMTDPEITRARVIAFGTGYNSHIPGYDKPLKTKPGQEVWNDSLTHRIISTAKKERELPDIWNEVGNEFIRDSVDQLEYEFLSFLESRKQEIVNNALKASIVNKRGK